jgi:hypothetical protein
MFLLSKCIQFSEMIRSSYLLYLIFICILLVYSVSEYSLPNIVWVVKSRRMRWAGHVARMGEERGVFRVLVGKTEGKRPLG